MTEVSDAREAIPKAEPRRMTPERMQTEYSYILAQQLTAKLLSEGLISADEFDKISALNSKKFPPYLAELIG